jgi:hypothetical protein
MVTNRFFSNYNEDSEQNLLEDLYQESIQIHGIDIYYIPRKIVSIGGTFREAEVVRYEEAVLTDAYIKDVTGYTGEGEFLSKFGLEIRDQMTLNFSARSFTNDVGKFLRIERPLEGDLIWFPLSKTVFVIKNVNRKSIFYQLGALYEHEVTTELFEYSNEEFATGIAEIDNRYNVYSTKEVLDDPSPPIEDSLLHELDKQSQNKFFQDMGDEIIDDFSTKNPFGDV